MLGAKQQGRLDGFFKPLGTTSGGSKKPAAPVKGGKRKVRVLISLVAIVKKSDIMLYEKGDDKEKAGAKKTKGKK